MPRRYRICVSLLGSVLLALGGWAAPAARADEGVHETAVSGTAADRQALAQYGDVREALTEDAAQQLLHRMVNAARSESGAPALDWSAAAAQLAQAQADAMTAGHFGAHYDAAGRKPAQRWNGLGGADQVEENIVYYEVNRAVGLTPQLLRHMLEDWLGSQSHRDNLLDPRHTASGCAFSIVRAQGLSYVAGVQEFVRDYGSYAQLPRRAPAGALLKFSGLLDPGVTLAFIGLAHEPLARPLTPRELLDHGWSYSAPSPVRSLNAREAGWSELDGSFATRLSLPAGWDNCAVYVTVWVRAVDDPPSAEPFCAMTQVVSLGS